MDNTRLGASSFRTGDRLCRVSYDESREAVSCFRPFGCRQVSCGRPTNAIAGHPGGLFPGILPSSRLPSSQIYDGNLS